jgi:hypothetical protein
MSSSLRVARGGVCGRAISRRLAHGRCQHLKRLPHPAAVAGAPGPTPLDVPHMSSRSMTLMATCCPVCVSTLGGPGKGGARTISGPALDCRCGRGLRHARAPMPHAVAHAGPSHLVGRRCARGVVSPAVHIAVGAAPNALEALDACGVDRQISRVHLAAAAAAAAGASRARAGACYACPWPAAARYARRSRRTAAAGTAAAVRARSASGGARAAPAAVQPLPAASPSCQAVVAISVCSPADPGPAERGGGPRGGARG